MNTNSYDELMAVFLDVITNEIQAIRNILSKRRGPRTHDELMHNFSLLVGSDGINSRYTDLNIPRRCYIRMLDTRIHQGFIKKKMSLYKRLMRKLNRHIYNFYL
jgi:hypothetical protein